MKEQMLLNVGCGAKFHKDFVNIDMISNSQEVKQVNLLKGIPFADNTFDVVYHSQVLEHFSKDQGLALMKECYRVLKPGGIIRVVVPDLENIIDEYKKCLSEAYVDNNLQNKANYEWILLELFDQVGRNTQGGEMAKYLEQKNIVNREYVVDRIGYVATQLLNKTKEQKVIVFNKRITFKRISKKIVSLLFKKKYQAIKIGEFRLGGEIHQWMYDKYSLLVLLKECGFIDSQIRNPFESEIMNWEQYKLDVNQSIVYDPYSLFMEARK